MRDASVEALREAVATALGRVASGLFVVSAREAAGEVETAFLGSWIMQAGFDPPALTVAVGKQRAALAMLREPGSRFAVSIIAETEKAQVGPFARGIEPAPRALEPFEVERTTAGLAVVRGCLAWVACVTRGHVESGDHAIVLGEVVDARGGRTDRPAVHVRANGLGY